MDSHNERRGHKADRRSEDSGLFPIQDHAGKWVVTDRRERNRRHSGDSMGVWGGLKTVMLASVVLILVICWMMIRFGVIPSPGWMPSWLIFPEVLLQHLQ